MVLWGVLPSSLPTGRQAGLLPKEKEERE